MIVNKYRVTELNFRCLVSEKREKGSGKRNGKGKKEKGKGMGRRIDGFLNNLVTVEGYLWGDVSGEGDLNFLKKK